MGKCVYDNQEIWGAILYSPDHGMPTVDEIANRIESELKIDRYDKQNEKFYRYDAVVIIIEGNFITELIHSKDEFYSFLERNARFQDLIQRL